MENKYDLAQAERFKFFRKKYINNNSAIAATELKIPQSRISNIENGKNPIGPPLIKLLETKYKLNKYWLLDNDGNPLKNDSTSKSSLNKSIEMGDRIDQLNTSVRVLQINLDKAYKMIDALQKRVDSLEGNSR